MRVLRFKKPFLGKRRWSIWPAHEHRNGRAVLRDESSWRTIRGVGINYAGRSVWFVLNPVSEAHHG